MLIDDFLPEYTVAERHAIAVRASPETVYRAIRTADLAGAGPVRLLLALRAMPAALEGRTGLTALVRRRRSTVTFEDFQRHGFALLAENAPQEIVLGLVGAFWTLTGGLCRTDAVSFRSLQPPGTARAAWNFVVEPLDGGYVRLSTETRVQPSDAASARRFRAYWLLVRPWSGLTRRYMLRAIRHEAERQR